MSEITRIYIDLPPKLVRPQKRDGYKTGEAPQYTARLHSPDGEIIVDGSSTPFFATARKLQQRGVTGILEMWDSVLPFARLRQDIDEAARLTVIETDKIGPHLAKYQPFPGRGLQTPAGGKPKEVLG